MAITNQNRLPRLTPKDLQDPSLSKLHSILDQLMTQAQYPQGVQGKVTVQNEMKAPNMKISQPSRNLQSDDVVTYGDLTKIGVIELVRSAGSAGGGSGSSTVDLGLIIPTY